MLGIGFWKHVNPEVEFLFLFSFFVCLSLGLGLVEVELPYVRIDTHAHDLQV